MALFPGKNQPGKPEIKIFAILSLTKDDLEWNYKREDNMKEKFQRINFSFLPVLFLLVACNAGPLAAQGGEKTNASQVNSNYTINHPFPQADIISNFGIRPNNYSQAEMNAQCLKAFNDWVKYWITTNNCPPGSARPHLGPGPGIPYYAEPYGSMSEFVGWGLIVCVLLDNDQNRTRNLFDRLNNFRKAYTNQWGLMNSTINYKKPMDSFNKDSATEADENLAMGLLMAHYQWGSDSGTDYLAEATNLIGDISRYLVERPAYVLKPAVTWGGSALLDPCYYDSIYYPLWHQLTGDSAWTKLDDHYRFLVTYFINQFGTGLLPDWCKADGTSPGVSGKPYFYSWDAQQISTKWAIHYAWYGTSKTDIFFNAAKKFAVWVKKQAKGNLSSLTDSYTLDGTPCGTYPNLPGVVGAMGLSGTVSSDYQSLVNDSYAYLLTLNSGANYNFSLSLHKVVQMLVYTGNFVNFTGLESN